MHTRSGLGTPEGEIMQVTLWRNRSFLILWVGQTISALGSPFTFIASAWYVYAITGSKLALGGIMLANAVPLACARIFAGTLVDRWERRRVMLVTDTTRAICLALIVVALRMGAAHLWYFYLLNAILGLSDAFFQPAAFALLPNLVESQQLVQANGWFNSSINGAMILGPAIAGGLIATSGASVSMGIDCITFAISAFSLFLLPIRAISHAPATRHFVRDIAEGFGFFGKHVGLLWLLLLVGVYNLGFGMVVPIVLPYSIHVLHAGAAGFGLLQTAIGVGMLIGSLVSPLLKQFVRRKVMVPALILSGCLFVCFAITRHFWIVMAYASGFGIGTAIWNTFSSTFYQDMVPDGMRGRVQSVRLLLAQGAFPLGMALGPGLSDWLSVSGVFALAGGCILMTGLIAYPRASVRALDKLDHVKPSIVTMGSENV